MDTELSIQISLLTDRVQRLELASTDSVARRHRARKRTSLTALAIGIVATAGTVMADMTGLTLQQFIDMGSFSTPPLPPIDDQPSLDSLATWSRRDPPNTPVASTNEILSLVAEATQQNSYTWPLFIQLTATNDPNATVGSSNSEGVTVRSFNRSTGSPWLAGYHSELFHGQDGINGPYVNANGTSILYNGELTTHTSSGTTIGLIYRTP